MKFRNVDTDVVVTAAEGVQLPAPYWVEDDDDMQQKPAAKKQPAKKSAAKKSTAKSGDK